MDQYNKIGLVLSGGGYRGAAHIGVLKAMAERNITPNYISGTSAGAIIGALYAKGMSWEEIFEFLKGVDVFSIRNYTFLKAGLLDSNKYIDFFKQVFPKNDFDELKIPLFIATTDLINAKTRFYFQGKLIEPLVAAASLPGIFSPVKFNGRLLCDGGVTDNLPVEPLVPISDKIIGVYVNPLEDISEKKLKTTKAVLERSYLIMRESITKRNINKCDIVIAPKSLNKFNFLSKNNLDEIFEEGYKEACRKLDEWLLDRK